MKVSSLGEFGLIARIRKRDTSRRFQSRSVILGIGDDAAVFRPTPGFDLLLTTDLLLEGVHFPRAGVSLRDIGYKAIAVNVSDIAAMGGIPRAYLVSLALPGDFPVRDLEQLYAGMRSGARESEIALLGGNTSSSARLFINLTLVGEVERRRQITRAGARAGDLLLVTGTLGDSASGCDLLRHAGRRRSHSPRHSFLIRRHLRPTARWREGRLLLKVASAMIDLSDGLSSDLTHLCDASGVGVELGASLLPISRPLRALCRLARKDPLLYALDGGEDYELLFTVPERRIERLYHLVRRGLLRVAPIGKILPKREGRGIIGPRGRVPLRPKGYRHF